MRLLTAHLENFRSVATLDMDFSADACHAITGRPGAGKSSVFAGLLFAMYGNPGPDQDLLDLRYDRAADRDPVVADYTWEHNGTVYRTRRELRRGNRNGKPIERASAQLWRDSTEVEGMTPTALTKEVTAIIGMSDRSYAGSSLIRQGEVDTLTTAAPGVVQELVEAHTGIGAITKLRDSSRKKASEARAVAESLPGSLDDVESTADAARTAHEQAGPVLAAHEQAAARAARARDNWEHADSAAAALRDTARNAQRAREELVAAEAAFQAAQDAADKADHEVQLLDCDTAADAAELDGHRDSLTARRSALAEVGNAVYYTQKEVAAADADVTSAASELDNSSDRRQQLQHQLAQLDTDYLAAQDQLRSAHVDVNTAQAEVSNLDKALTALAGAHAFCPTCRQQLDDPDTLIATLTAQRDQAGERVTTARQKASSTSTQISGIKQQMTQLRGHVDELDKLTAAHQQSVSRARRATAARDQALARCTELLQQPADSADTAVELVKTVIADVDADLGRIAEQRAALRTAALAWQTVRQATDRHDLARAAVVDAPDPAVVDAAISEATRLRVDFDDASREAADAASAANAAKVGCTQLDSAAETAAAQWARKQSAVREAEVANTTAGVLSAYRQDLIADFCAGISAAATELLERFGGEHVAFHLDADFVPRVELADGRIRKTSSLSGGEKARAGLAFRLGISMQITGDALPDQIIADEVTTYLDEEGRAQVVATIAGLFASPILISHTSEILDYATVVHHLQRSPLGTTELVDATTE